MFGAAIAGGVAVPFNTFAEPRELDHLLRHSDVGIVITQSRVPAPSVRRRDRARVRTCRRTPDRDSSARPSTRSSGGSSRSTPPTAAWCSRGTSSSPTATWFPTTSSTPSCARPRRATTASSSTAPGRPPCPRVCSTCTGPPCCRAGATGTGRDSPPMTGCTASSRSSGRPASRRWSERPSRAVPASCCIRCSTATTRSRLIEEERATIVQMLPHHDGDLQEAYRVGWARHLDDPARPVPHHTRATTREAKRQPSGLREQRDVHERDRAPERCAARGPRHPRSAHRRLEHPDHRRRVGRSARAGRGGRDHAQGAHPHARVRQGPAGGRRSTRRATSTPATPAGSTTAGCSTGPVGSRP